MQVELRRVQLQVEGLCEDQWGPIKREWDNSGRNKGNK